MQIIRDLEALRDTAASLRGGSMAFVPTMGALHAGHLALVEEAKRRAAHVAVSIFVNPTQFAPNEDLDAYPRREADDAAMLEAAGVALLWAPSVEQMYPAGFATTIHVADLGEGLCGAARPGHFDGVATVVAKLLGQIRPDVALFGEKDWQQLAIIRRMVRDLDLGVEIVGVPVQRDRDGLALSSRNAYLSAEDRVRARELPAALNEAARGIEAGEDANRATATAADRLGRAGVAVEYFELRDADTLGPAAAGRAARLLVAARIGRTRLIDNVPVITRQGEGSSGH